MKWALPINHLSICPTMIFLSRRFIVFHQKNMSINLKIKYLNQKFWQFNQIVFHFLYKFFIHVQIWNIQSNIEKNTSHPFITTDRSFSKLWSNIKWIFFWSTSWGFFTSIKLLQVSALRIYFSFFLLLCRKRNWWKEFIFQY
jgi:hypothetical protein